MDTTPHALAAGRESVLAAPVLDLVVPVRDEERDLERAVRTARAFLDTQLPYPARLTIADRNCDAGRKRVLSRFPSC